MSKKKKIAQKVVYRTREVERDNTAKLKSEIQELEAKRLQATEGKKGIRRFFAGAGYTKAINERRAIINQATTLQRVRQQTEIEKAKTELSKARADRVNFNKTGVLKLEDLY